MDSGKTILNLEGLGTAGLPRGDAMLRAVREAAAGVYDLLGELGRNRYGSIVYLGRELATGNLSALKLDASSGSPNEMELTVVGELDDSVPALGYECHFCGQRLDTWGRFCTSCGRDVSGIVSALTSAAEREQLLAAVKAAAAGEYEILGEMKRARGGGIVYFARELATGQISALRLQRDANAQSRGEAEYSLGKTQVLKPLVEGLEHVPPPVSPPRRDSGVRPIVARPNDYVGPALADGRVSELPPPPPPPVEAPPTQEPKRMSTTYLLIGGVAVILILAVAAIAVSTTDDSKQDPVVAVEPPPPQPQPQPPPPQPQPEPPPPAAVDTGIIELQRLPQGAEVLVDGVRSRGTTLRLAVGRHVIEGTAPGFQRVRQSVDVTAGRRQMGLRWVPTPDTTKRVAGGGDPGPPPPTKSPCVVATEASNWQVIRQACPTDARAGNGPAMRSLAVAYLRGGSADEAEAVAWLQKSADAGNRESQYDLGRLYQTVAARRNERRAIELFRSAGNAGHADARYQLARMYEKGQGTAKNEGEAFRWYRLAAEQGHAPAQGGLGVFYLKGIGIRRNDAEARQWLEKSANAGFAPAMYNLGTMYEEGRAGLPKSRTTAREWYRKAANLGDAEAKKALGTD